MERLKAKRSGRRAQNTRIGAEASAILQSSINDPVTFTAIRDRLMTSNDTLRIINQEIDPLIPDDDVEAEYLAAAEYDDQAVSLLSELNSRIAQAERSSLATATTTPVLQPNVTSTAAIANLPRLPVLEIATFSGELHKWMSFWEQFEGLIHKNSTITANDKFHFLRKYLAGDAAATIAGLPTTETCYTEAITMLHQRFGDKQKIEQQHLTALRHLPRVKSANDLRALRKLYDATQLNVRCLIALGVATSSFSAMLCNILLHVLPYEIVLDYHRKRSSLIPCTGPTVASTLEQGLDGSSRLATETRNTASMGDTADPESNEPANDIRSPTSVGDMKDLINFVRLELESRERIAHLRFPEQEETREKRKPTPSSFALQSAASSFSQECFFCKSRKHVTDSCDSKLPLNEKKKLLSKDVRCFKCTTKGHRARACRRKIVCSTCQGRHATTMCDPTFVRSKKEQNGSQPANSTVCVSSASPEGAKQNMVEDGVHLQTFRAWIITNRGRSTYVRGILDGGSQRTFIKEDIAKRLKLKFITRTKISLNTFAREDANVYHSSVVEVRLCSQFDSTECIIQAYTIPVICQDIARTKPDASFMVELKQLQHKQLADELMFPCVQEEPGISLLIGSDQIWKLLTGEVQRSKKVDGLVAANTTMGWTLQGPTRNVSVLHGASHLMVCVLRAHTVCEEEKVSETLRSSWELDSMGISQNDASDHEQDVIKAFEDQIVKTNGRYEVALMWKQDGTQTLDDNRETAVSRLQSLVRRITKKEGLLQRYDKAIKQYVTYGYAERVPSHLIDGLNRPTFYMPHREVIRESSLTTKMRVVFDASSHAKGSKSLNECLETGPNLNPDLLHILLRFRWHPIAMTADIEKAFLQVGVREEDRDAFRFLWFAAEPSFPMNKEDIQEYRMTRVPFGSTSSPFLLTATIQHHLKTVSPQRRQIAEVLHDSFYVDDLLVGANTIEEALKLYETSKAIMEDANMPLRKWATNNEQLQVIFQEQEPDLITEGQKVEMTRAIKVLGMTWNMDNDCFMYTVSNLLTLLSDMQDTKRCVLKAASRVFDPLGFISPYVLRAKLLFQKLWIIKSDWDAELPEDLKEEWHTWTRELVNLCSLTIPRYLWSGLSSSPNDLEIHVFVDASTKAYGACAYIRAVDSLGNVSTALVMAKSRIAPIKVLTLPRLELMGALVGARLLKYLKVAYKNIDTINYVMWTDSMIVLSWLRAPPEKWQLFVKNRVQEIHQITHPKQWRYCPGTENPADLLTRGVSAQSLHARSVWWKGPCWLAYEFSEWPSELAITVKSEEDVSAITDTRALLGHTTTNEGAILDVTHYSKLSKLLRVTAWIVRFKRNSSKKYRSKGPLATDELQFSEDYWIRQTQNEVFPEECSLLKRSRTLPQHSELSSLHPYMDEAGILRVGGRLQNLRAVVDVKHPIILPTSHHFTKLVVMDAHSRVFHSGVASTMSHLRERFWVLRARQLVKKTIKACLLCSRFRTKTISEPYAPLPACRIEQADPFKVSGVDFAGPLYAKTRSNSHKVYIVLFTCAVTRAVHLEISTDLTAGAFLLAFRRFISRRGAPNVVYSDNALAFKKASRELQKIGKLLADQQFKDYLTDRRITWKFIPAGAPWWGGWWERLVRSVKTVLRKVLGRTSMTLEELATVLTEVEAIVNSRPLTYLNSSADEPSPITPAHFLIGRSLTVLPEANRSDRVTTMQDRQETLRRYKYRLQLTEHFWNRWKSEYLTQLRSAHFYPNVVSSNLKVDDVVLLDTGGCPKYFWQLGRIVDIYPGKDGRVRACLLKTKDGSVLRRPVQKLRRLEIRPI